MAASCKDLFGNFSFLLKFIVWILLVVGSVIMALGDIYFYDRFSSDSVTIAVAGFCLIISATLVVYIFDEPHRLYELLFLITGGILNCVSGIMNLIAYIQGHGGRTANSLILLVVCIAAGVLMLVDFVFKLKK